MKNRITPFTPETAISETTSVNLHENIKTGGTPSQREPRIRFFTPDELRAYEPEEGVVLAGDCHIMRGEVFVIGGEPGVGKSTAATELAICGATGADWLGLPVHARFKTMIIQNENGRFRLQQEYTARAGGSVIDDAIRVSEPPPFGMTLNHPEFLADVRAALYLFRPDVVIFDPWNAAAKDDKAADYVAAFDALRAMLPTGASKPALGIVAHTKKPQIHEKRTGGSGLMHLLSGSYVLTSVPRAIFIMVRGSGDETDNSIVWFNPKNSNGPCVARTAWRRAPQGFTPIKDFAWDAFDDTTETRGSIQWSEVQEVLKNGPIDRNIAVKNLALLTGCTLRACQKVIHEDSRFASRLILDDVGVMLKP